MVGILQAAVLVSTLQVPGTPCVLMNVHRLIVIAKQQGRTLAYFSDQYPFAIILVSLYKLLLKKLHT
jgi:hypothetical protein